MSTSRLASLICFSFQRVSSRFCRGPVVNLVASLRLILTFQNTNPRGDVERLVAFSWFVSVFCVVSCNAVGKGEFGAVVAPPDEAMILGVECARLMRLGTVLEQTVRRPSRTIFQFVFSDEATTSRIRAFWAANHNRVFMNNENVQSVGRDWREGKGHHLSG